MSAVLRVHRRPAPTRGSAPSEELKDYLERLVKLIPAEVVGIYLSGKSLIQAVYAKETAAASTAARRALLDEQAPYWIGWTIFCFAALVAIRLWATSSPGQGLRPQGGAVAIAAVSFLIWVYNFGDAFTLLPGLWQPLLAGLLVIAWTFVAPFLYRGDSAPTPGPAGPARAPVPPGAAPGENRPSGQRWRLPWGPKRSAPQARPMTDGESEAIVLDATRPRQSALAKIKELYTSTELIRRYLIKVEQAVELGGWGRVDLTGSDATLDTLGGKNYLELASWVRGKVAARGAGQ